MKFDTSHDADPQQEYKAYCEKLQRSKTKYTIEGESTKPDGSLVVKIKKQYNSYKTDGYLD